MTEGRESKSTD